MKMLWIGTCVAAAAMSTTFVATAGFKSPASPEVARLRALDSRSLADLRAGRIETCRPIGGTERARMLAAQTANSDLASLRAGDVTNSTLITILLVLAIVAVVVILI